MSTSVMLLVLLAAFLHASWNAVVKSSPDKFLDIVLVTTAAAILAVLFVPFLPAPLPASWPCLAASAVIHVVYFALVGAAYHRGDMSYAYPLMRGVPPLLISLASGPLIGEHLSAAGWAGILLICGGVLGLTFFQRSSSKMAAGTTVFALANAVVIATYTLVDGVGVRLSGHAAAYTMWLFLLTAPAIFVWAVMVRHVDICAHVRRRWHFGLIGGACTIGAYTLVLWAMTQAPVAMVAALRETAILFGTAISALVLKERFGWSRHAAAALIMLGAVVLKLA